jgi:hypothetical protein
MADLNGFKVPAGWRPPDLLLLLGKLSPFRLALGLHLLARQFEVDLVTDLFGQRFRGF